MNLTSPCRVSKETSFSTLHIFTGKTDSSDETISKTVACPACSTTEKPRNYWREIKIRTEVFNKKVLTFGFHLFPEISVEAKIFSSIFAC